MRKRFFASALAGLCLATVSAQDVFVYNAQTSTPTMSLGNLQRIEFNEGSLNFVMADGTSQNAPLATVDYMLFFNREMLNSVRQTPETDGVRFSFNGSELEVQGAEPVSRLEVFTSDGVRVATVAPESRRATVSLAAQAPGVYIVRAVAGKAVATSEILKNK